MLWSESHHTCLCSHDSAWSSHWRKLMIDGLEVPLNWTSVPSDRWTYVYLESSYSLANPSMRLMSSNPAYAEADRRKLLQSTTTGALKGSVADVALWTQPPSPIDMIRFARDTSGSIYPSGLSAMYVHNGFTVEDASGNGRPNADLVGGVTFGANSFVGDNALFSPPRPSPPPSPPSPPPPPPPSTPSPPPGPSSPPTPRPPPSPPPPRPPPQPIGAG